MRRILIESARRKAVGRNVAAQSTTVRELDAAADHGCDPDLLLDLDEGLTRLAQLDPEAAKLVKLRLFAGLSVAEAGEMLGMSRSAAYRNWDFVRSWFAVHCGTGAE
jgi:DNA-directed RNA polymerase specialized sigma24 family protein